MSASTTTATAAAGAGSRALGPTIKAALIDISGTLHVGREAIPGAVEACRKLRRQKDLRVLFLTNTSTMSTATLLGRLREMGFDESAVPSDGIVTSVGAARRYLLRNGLRPHCLVEEDLLLGGDFAGVEMEDPNCVLVGLAPTKFDYEHLNAAFRLLSRLRNDHPGDRRPRLIAIHRAAHYRDSDHGLSLGPGEFVSLLERAAGVAAHVVGKPSRDFYRAALASLGVEDPSGAVMVGDDVAGDVRGALDAGFGGAILVRTGKYVDGDESGRGTGGVVPTLTACSIVEAVDHICSALE